MEERTHVLVGRKWHAPEITVGVSSDGISIAMQLDDFLAALAEEMGSPALMLTKAGLLTRIEEAGARVVRGMKSETSRVL